MFSVSSQLTLGLNLQDEATFANFHVGDNLEVVTALKKLASGEGEGPLYLSGATGLGGVGRSHLLQACCHHAERHQRQSAYLPLQHLLASQVTPDILLGFESFALVCLDDIQVIAKRPEWEEAIFHLYNRIHDAKGALIVSANEPPALLGFALPDLASRLSWGVVYSLQAPSDEAKLTILINRADKRGIHLSDEVGRYILTHCPRNMHSLCAALDALDKASLAAQRRLTIPFVKAVLKV